VKRVLVGKKFPGHFPALILGARPGFRNRLRRLLFLAAAEERRHIHGHCCGILPRSGG
jgi:hypothetical protein